MKCSARVFLTFKVPAPPVVSVTPNVPVPVVSVPLAPTVLVPVLADIVNAKTVNLTVPWIGNTTCFIDVYRVWKWLFFVNL